MRVVVFGATGGLGSASVQKALAAGHQVTAFVRNPDKLRIRRNHDAVLSALGPAAGSPAGTLISKGTRFILDGMKTAGVRRFVFASGLMVGPAAGMNFFKRQMIGFFRLIHRALYVDKVKAEVSVRDSGLDWIIVRPPVLADLPARGKYRVGPDLDVRLMDKFAFADVADYMVRGLSEDEFLHQAVELSY